ncbi:MAG: glycoside hydrolase family 78 protein [candidate division KSB1 bacterium]|nr:glycoside hydrolase family 78 protein [candidate division KSB1 bacterium]
MNPIGIDVEKPRLSWKIQSDRPDRRNIRQKAYEIRVAASPEELASGKRLVWQTGKIMSDQSVHVGYRGPAPLSRQRFYWQVRVWDEKNVPSQWSEPAFWEMGLLNKSDWKAKWIRADLQENPEVSSPANLLRKEFKLKGQIKSARAYITSLGLYEAELNGKKIGDELLTPGWTAYQDHIQYQTYDVTFLLKAGENAVGVTLGDGWYRGNIGWQGNRNTYGDKLALLFQLEVLYSDGSREIIVSDESWKSSTGPILMSDIYNGETYDARLEKSGWTLPRYDDRSWGGVVEMPAPNARLVAPAGPPVRAIEEIKPVKIFKTPKGETVVDMGQNMVGHLRVKVQGPAGTTVIIRHAEVLDKEGNFYTENLRSAKQTITYTLKGKGVEVFEPHFTFQGFRYAAVEGWPGELTLDALTGIVVHSDMEPSGDFSCSNDMINQLQHNIRWGQKGNFVDVPTDCPQRDERLGWTGDAQVFAPTACFNFNTAAFYTKWLKDFTADQQAEGQIPHVVPDVLSIKRGKRGESASAGWADAAVIVPWTVYLAFGDVGILEKQYDCMKGWVDYMAARAGEKMLWDSDFTFGDWLAFATDRSDYPGAATDKTLICQAYFARSTELLQKAAAVLGKTEDAAKYAALHARIKKVFQDEFVTPNGRLVSHTQTAYALALAFNLLPDELKPIAAKHLADDVNRFRHITTGFLGTPVICHVLSAYGYEDEAFMLLNRTEYPSWLYPITKGATTIWERWDGIKPDGSFQNPGMNSFNHYAYGAIGEWLYRYVAGIEIDEQAPGYKHVIIQPHPGGGLTWARAEHESMYGKIVSSWKLQDGKMLLEVVVPPNTTATVILPKIAPEQVMEQGKRLRDIKGVLGFEQKDQKLVIRIGSGSYQFSARL